MSSIQDLLELRYYRNGESRWCEIANRVALHLFPEDPEWRAKTEQLLVNKDFLPSSPVLMNAGSSYPMLCSCFVLPVDDSIASIMQSLTDTMMIQKYGGGVGLSFSAIRPDGSLVRTTEGKASGPVSFMGFWNEGMNVIRQGGKRQGAMMGVLNVDHQDLLRFLSAKTDQNKLTNFNLSVGITREFAKDWKKGGTKVWPCGDTTSGIISRIAKHAWDNGEPGLLFLDNINENTPFPMLIEATNPCGEQPLPPYGACCLGSINLASALVQDKETLAWELDFARLRVLARRAGYIMNKVLDTTRWPLKAIENFEKEYRPIGVGVMGLADVLASLGLPYDSAAGRACASAIMVEVKEGVECGADKYAAEYNKPYNTTYLSIAPTGTISMLAEVNYSIEPFFSHAYTKRVEAGDFKITNNIVWRVAKAFHYNLTKLDVVTIKETGSVRGTSCPKQMKRALRTALEISPISHLKMQNVVQHEVDSAVSKTINLPYDTSPEEIVEIINTAHSWGLKGLTVYRNGSRNEEVISMSCPTGGCE